MKSKALIEAFLAEPAMAVVGVSRSGKGFGNAAARESRHHHQYAGHPGGDRDGARRIVLLLAEQQEAGRAMAGHLAVDCSPSRARADGATR